MGCAPRIKIMKNKIREKIQLEGRVQGVGFRPFVYRLAQAYGLNGETWNTDEGLTIEVEGEESSINGFIEQLLKNHPPAAYISNMIKKRIPVQAREGFVIRESRKDHSTRIAGVTPDLAMCSECERELFDPQNERYLYPLINCTNCGPRFSIIREVPYDRISTTMADFSMCDFCREQYADPLNRRYHAQPVSCHQCGPRIDFLIPAKNGEAASILPEKTRDRSRLQNVRTVQSIFERASHDLRTGKILLIKGIGGYHLACNALDEKAVVQLREKKMRDEKPFAVLFSGYDQLETCCLVSQKEWELLEGPPAPIVLLPKKEGGPLAPSVAPGLDRVGAILPYTPILRLLVQWMDFPLVLTSANRSDEPIYYRDSEAMSGVGSLADALLLHDRPIETRVDDSVLLGRGEGNPLFLRRSRGYAPMAMELPFSFSTRVLAAGGDLKNTFSMLNQKEIILSHHLGDLKNPEALISYKEALAHFSRLFSFEPHLLAIDCHPGFSGSNVIKELYDVPVIEVQHHHAHAVSAMLDHGHPEQQPVIGLVLDGTGAGEDGQSRGGEIFIADYVDYTRWLEFAPVRLAGGQKAIHEIWRIGLSLLFDAGVGEEQIGDFYQRGQREWKKYRQDFEQSFETKGVLSLLNHNRSTVSVSSCGRLFDGVASLLGIKQFATHEGQGAMLLEALARPRSANRRFEASDGGYLFELQDGESLVELNWRPAVLSLFEDIRRGGSKETISWRFHRGLAAGLVRAIERLYSLTGIKTVALSGGCFYNVILTAAIESDLKKKGYRVYLNRSTPPGDGGISAGQAVIAASKYEERQTCVWQFQ